MSKRIQRKSACKLGGRIAKTIRDESVGEFMNGDADNQKAEDDGN